MAETFKAVIGRSYDGRMVAVSKAEIALSMTNQIMCIRKHEAFKALPLDEKYETLKSYTSLIR